MSTLSERQATFNTAYLHVLMKLNEIGMQLSIMATAAFVDSSAQIVPAPSPHLRTDTKELHGALGDVSRRVVSHPRAKRVSAVTKRDTGKRRKRATPRDSTGPVWVGDPRRAYRRSSKAIDGLKVPSGARKLWDALDQQRTGPELSKLTRMKRKQVEKMTGALRGLGLIETVDLRVGRIDTAGS